MATVTFDPFSDRNITITGGPYVGEIGTCTTRIGDPDDPAGEHVWVALESGKSIRVPLRGCPSYMRQLDGENLAAALRAPHISDILTKPEPPMERGQCRSCRAEIGWLVTTAGKRMPVDPTPLSIHPTPEGGDVVVRPNGSTVRGVLGPGGLLGYTSHFATCPAAGAHRQRR